MAAKPRLLPAIRCTKPRLFWVETTLIPQGFAEAWKRGSEVYRDLENRGELRRYDVFRAQLEYPATIPANAVGDIGALDAGAVRERLERDAHSIEVWRQQYRGSDSSADSAWKAPPSEITQAMLEFTAGDFDLALRRLQAFVSREQGSAAGWNDLGVVLASNGPAGPAIERFERAAALEPQDAGIWLNLGLAQRVSGESPRGLETLARGIERAGGLSAACALLGVPVPAVERSDRLPASEAARLLVDDLTHAGASRSDSVPALLRALYWKE